MDVHRVLADDVHHRQGKMALLKLVELGNDFVCVINQGSLDKLHGIGSRVGAAAASREEAHGGLRLRKPDDKSSELNK